MKRHWLVAVWVVVVILVGNAQAQRLLATDWPFPAMPTEEDLELNPEFRGYAVALERWLEANPTVTLENIEVAIWDQQALLTAVAGGVAPAWFPGQVMGGWNDASVKSLMAQGFMADITEELGRYGVLENLSPAIREIWDDRWMIDGRYYGLPVEFSITMGVYYRKDLIRELGLEEPQPGWTWDDFRELAKALTTESRKGAVIQGWQPWGELNANGLVTIMDRVPAPETGWNWRWDYTSNIDQWVSVLGRWRTAIHEDQSILTEPGGLSDGDVTAAFLRGDAAMMFNNAGWFTRRPDDANSMSQLADRLGQPLEEVVGWVPLPGGDFDTLGTSETFFFFLTYNPDLNADELDKAVSLAAYMLYGEGAQIQQQLAFEEFQDTRFVFNQPIPIDGRTEIPGIPQSLSDTWGEAFLANVNTAVEAPRRPEFSVFFPVETEAGPGTQALTDALNTIIHTRGNVDIAAEIANAERIINQQAASFRSSIPDEVFTESARNYFAALNDFFAEHSPEWHREVFGPWYEANVVPAVGN